MILQSTPNNSDAIISPLDQFKFTNSHGDVTSDRGECANERNPSNMSNPAINDVTRVNNFVQQVR